MCNPDDGQLADVAGGKYVQQRANEWVSKLPWYLQEPYAPCQPLDLLTANEVKVITGLGLSTIYEYREGGIFRGPRLRSKRIYGWSLLEYLADLNAPRRVPQPVPVAAEPEALTVAILTPPSGSSSRRKALSPVLHLRPPA
jgi:hypothetical protein